MRDYLSILYDKKKKPITKYPYEFTNYNIKRFNLKNKKLLEIGCGRGDFINEFSKQNVKCFATDMLASAKNFLTDKVDFKQHDINNNKLPYDDNFFDAIYTKSLIEHLSEHEFFFNECKRILKKNGVLIIYTPDWESQYLHFFDDITHVKPFTKITLENCFKMYGFNNYKIEKFYQLPISWKFPLMKILFKMIAPLIPIRSQIKFLRFSKELMLLGYGFKN